MKLKLQYHFFIIILFISCPFYGQNISLYQQYNGRFDFVFIGNTLNNAENNNIDGQPDPPCTIKTASSASLNLNPNDIIESAYLYWAGSGPGDFNVKLNDQDITAQRTFDLMYFSNNTLFPFFSAFADITSLIQTTGNGIYNFSDMDLTGIIPPYCTSTTNFGGWAIVIVYKNNDLPLNQLNIYDGLQGIPNEINITLNSLNVIDNKDAEIGFVAWEGDKNISVNESLRINGNLIENLPLNPGNNAFNGTNSFTGATDLYNMDLDVYGIQNNINIGDSTAEIQLTSSRDFVMINTIVTKLNSQLPDATIVFDTELECNSRRIIANYEVSNLNSTDPLPAETPIAIYANDVLIQQTKTTTSLPINGSESGIITLQIPPEIPNNFDMKFVIDDDGTGSGIIAELNEINNAFLQNTTLLVSEPLIPLENVSSCNLGLTKGEFDFSNYEDLIKVNPTDVVEFYPTNTDLENGTNIILNTSNYTAETTPQSVFVKVDNGICFNTTSFLLTTKNCPPTVYNFVSANNDFTNDTFFIDGLRDIFMNFNLYIYNRWGTLVWKGNNNIPDWDGYATKGMLLDNSGVPAGTYFYVLDLNDKDYPKPLTGYLYLTR
ncbi:MAG TPA: gliding motility-associated C-terminal domain-containing protein [Flavobacterium sp.]